MVGFRTPNDIVNIAQVNIEEGLRDSGEYCGMAQSLDLL